MRKDFLLKPCFMHKFQCIANISIKLKKKSRDNKMIDDNLLFCEDGFMGCLLLVSTAVLKTVIK